MCGMLEQWGVRNSEVFARQELTAVVTIKEMN